MGDIYHMIKQRVDKLSIYKPQPKGSKKTSSVNSNFTNMKSRMKKLKSSDSEDSFKSVQKDENLHEYAENLREQYKKNPQSAIDRSVIFKKQQNAFLTKQQMMPKEKVGDIVIPSSNIDQLMDMVKRHYKKIDNEKKGKREMREIQQIFKGTLREFPEYIERMKRKKEKEEKSIGNSRNTLHSNTHSGVSSRQQFPVSFKANQTLQTETSRSTMDQNFRRGGVNLKSKLVSHREKNRSDNRYEDKKKMHRLAMSLNKDSTVTFVPAVQQKEPFSPSELNRYNGVARSPSQTYYPQAPPINALGSPDHKDKLTIHDSMEKKLSDPHFPLIIGDSRSMAVGESPSPGPRPLSAKEQKEDQIYRTISEMPGRKIHFVEQRNDEQRRMEKEFNLRKTYDRLSLPSVYKRRRFNELNPHTKVQLSKAQKKMKM